jgi:hypothetical protein
VYIEFLFLINRKSMDVSKEKMIYKYIEFELNISLKFVAKKAMS